VVCVIIIASAIVTSLEARALNPSQIPAHGPQLFGSPIKERRAAFYADHFDTSSDLGQRTTALEASLAKVQEEVASGVATSQSTERLTAAFAQLQLDQRAEREQKESEAGRDKEQQEASARELENKIAAQVFFFFFFFFFNHDH
jgi:hypothetical protein